MNRRRRQSRVETAIAAVIIAACLGCVFVATMTHCGTIENVWPDMGVVSVRLSDRDSVGRAITCIVATSRRDLREGDHVILVGGWIVGRMNGRGE